MMLSMNGASNKQRHCIALLRKVKFLDRTNDDDDDEEEMEGEFEPEGVDGDEFQDMGVQISKLKRMFNQDMPRVSKYTQVTTLLQKLCLT